MEISSMLALEDLTFMQRKDPNNDDDDVTNVNE